LNLSFFISSRIAKGQQGGFSSTIHRIAIISIAVGLAASIVSFLIMGGFQETVKSKLFGFSGHILVTRFSTNNSPEEQPMDFKIALYNHPDSFPDVRHVQEYAHKAGLVKTDDEVLGVVIKGVGKSFDRSSFQDNMVAGRFLDFPDSGYANEIVLSQVIATKLKAKLEALRADLLHDPKYSMADDQERLCAFLSEGASRKARPNNDNPDQFARSAA